MIRFECAAILFDLDGVLVDSTSAVERAWRRWGAFRGIDAEEVIRFAHGRRTIETVRRFTPHLPAEAEVERIESEEARDLVGVSLVPGAARLIHSLPKGMWGVVTSGTRVMATSRLTGTGLLVPDALVTAEDVEDGKPHPAPYLKGAEKIGLQPEQCLVFEDTPAGIESAHGAGMKVIGVATTYAVEKLSAADAKVKTLEGVQFSRNGAGLEVTIA